MKPSDEVWILGGGKAPVVLAKETDDNSAVPPSGPPYILLGFSYVNSLMDGSAIGPDLEIRPCDLV